MGKFLKYLAIAALSCSLTLLANQCKEISTNVWRKVSTDELNPGQILELDMSKGYSFAENGVIYIVVMTADSSEQIVAAFPDGGYWTAPKPNPFLEELDREFKSLEEYLENKGTEIKKK
tara:strand:+ start:167 stop:523 length:357 start_codon:yes stop_codon:yes gene_type:complete